MSLEVVKYTIKEITIRFIENNKKLKILGFWFGSMRSINWDMRKYTKAIHAKVIDKSNISKLVKDMFKIIKIVAPYIK